MDIIQQMVKLVKINTRISSLHSSDEILREIMNEAMSLTGTSSAFVLQVSPGREISCLRQFYRDDGVQVSWSSSSALEAHDQKRMVYSTHAMESSTKPSIVMGSIQTLISAPLTSEPEGSLVLQLVGQDSSSIDLQSLSLLALFVSQVQVTISKTKLEEFIIRNAKLAAAGELAAQVAHDIRSPLAALDSVIGALTGMPEDSRLIIRSAVSRIRDIANGLIEKNKELRAAETRHPGGDATTTDADTDRAGIELLSSLIDTLITEKRAQYRSRTWVEITWALEVASYGLFSWVQPVGFKRVLSNLIDNSIEALEGDGTVTVSLVGQEERVLISVKDDGKGISPEILARLGRRGESYAKPGGSGLGLHHAKTSVESWGGTLEIRSQIDAGTMVVISLPRTRAPRWFVSELRVAPGPLVVLDDDISIHHVWQLRFDSLGLQEKSGEVLHFFTPTEFRAWVRADPTRAHGATYLVDYELLGAPETGLSLIAEHGLGGRAILVTSRFEERTVLEECLRLKVRMIPKGLAGFVPISFRAPQENPDAVLIDDDRLMHKVWQSAAKSRGKRLKVLSSPEQFLALAGTLEKGTPIYVDSRLEEGIHGEVFAKELHTQGFSNIFLCTGHPPESFPPMPWIKKIVGKEAPWN